MNTLIKSLTCVALALTLAVPAEAEKRKRWKELYSNVTADGMNELFRSVAHVGFDAANQNNRDLNKHALAIKWFDSNGVVHNCVFTTHGIWMNGEEKISSKTIDKPKLKIKYPLLKFGPKKGTGYRAVIHAPDGGTGLYMYWKGYWWEKKLGHLQKRLPAAVWTACPDFPSAKSLGAKVNHKQTSTNYMELLKQDRGDRVKRPDLITPNTVEKY